jgi:hypothetical protein
MYIELNKNNYYVAYCNTLAEVSPENAVTVIQVTAGLYQLLQSVAPWSMTTIDTTKIYDVPDIALFIPIPPALSATDIMARDIALLQGAMNDVVLGATL